MKTCWKCKTDKKLSKFNKNKTRYDGVQSICRECERDYRKTIRGKNTLSKAVRKYNKSNADKRKARYTISNAIAMGKLTRPDKCESCKQKRFVEAHHENYSKPLDVEWLCTKCHSEVCKKVRV